MVKKIIYWLDWKNKIIQPNSKGLNPISWAEVEKYPLTVYCDQNTWPYIEIEKHIAFTPEQIRLLITNEKKRTYQIGLATIKEIRGGTQENPIGLGSQASKLLHQLYPRFKKTHPRTGKEFFKKSNNWKFAPRFENLQQGIFKNVWKIDIKSCYPNIMHDHPLPCGEPEHITNPELIAQKIKEGKEGFVRFLLKNPAKIKNQQIPFLPDYSSGVKKVVKGGWFLYTKLFRVFRKQYKSLGKQIFIYTDFWTFAEKKGCVNKFLCCCQKLEKKEPKRGKMLANALYGVLGKNKFSGYHYHPFMLAVNHLAILKTYYLYRQFKPEQVLAIRSDCIFVQGELPAKLDLKLYHLERHDSVGLQGEENVYVFDKRELLARSLLHGSSEREKLRKWFEQEKSENIP